MNKKTWQKVSGVKAIITQDNDELIPDAVAAVLDQNGLWEEEAEDEGEPFNMIVNSSVIKNERFNAHLFLCNNPSTEEEAPKYVAVLVVEDSQSNVAWIENTIEVETSKEAKRAIRDIKDITELEERLHDEIPSFIKDRVKENNETIAFTNKDGVGVIYKGTKVADQPKIEATVRTEEAPAEDTTSKKDAKAEKARAATSENEKSEAPAKKESAKAEKEETTPAE